MSLRYTSSLSTLNLKTKERYSASVEVLRAVSFLQGRDVAVFEEKFLTFRTTIVLRLQGQEKRPREDIKLLILLRVIRAATHFGLLHPEDDGTAGLRNVRYYLLSNTA